LTYSALYIQHFSKYPPLNLSTLVKEVTPLLKSEDVDYPNTLSSYILFALGLRKDMVEDSIDISMFSKQFVILQLLNIKLLGNFKDKKDTAIKENLSLECQKILQNFFTNFLK
jgi:hypothetical protein